jgi:uracil-DNA glycosylase
MTTTSPLKSWNSLKFWDKPWQNIQHWYDKMLPDHILPRYDYWFKALELTPFHEVKVVILGQDPYHTKGMANGLAFSTSPHIKQLPASLRNILKEYQEDLGYPRPRSGDLSDWAKRGVLLLNTVLTVEEGKANSHKGLGWEGLTYEILRSLAQRGEIVFLLMGKQAQEYRAACSPCPIVCTPHPSPLAKGFLGSKPFSKVNQELVKLGVEPVDWRLQ